MKDDSFVVEAFGKNARKNYRNHKWIKKNSFQFFAPLRRIDKRVQKSNEQIFKVEYVAPDAERVSFELG